MRPLITPTGETKHSVNFASVHGEYARASSHLPFSLSVLRYPATIFRVYLPSNLRCTFHRFIPPSSLPRLRGSPPFAFIHRLLFAHRRRSLARRLPRFSPSASLFLCSIHVVWIALTLSHSISASLSLFQLFLSSAFSNPLRFILSKALLIYWRDDFHLSLFGSLGALLSFYSDTEFRAYLFAFAVHLFLNSRQTARWFVH